MGENVCAHFQKYFTNSDKEHMNTASWAVCDLLFLITRQRRTCRVNTKQSISSFCTRIPVGRPRVKYLPALGLNCIIRLRMYLAAHSLARS